MDFSIRLFFMNYLENNGMQYSSLSNTLISFSSSNHNYIFEYDPQTERQYFRFILPNIESNQVDENIRNRISELNRNIKLVKFVEMNDNVWIMAEQFCYSSESIDSLFNRLIGLLDYALSRYRSL